MMKFRIFRFEPATLVYTLLTGNQPDPMILKNCETEELSTKYKHFPNLLSILLKVIVKYFNQTKKNSFQLINLWTENEFCRNNT